MSAYFVDPATIDRLLTAWRTARAVVGLHEIPDGAACTAAGRMMLKENSRSVAYRYASMGADDVHEMETAASIYRYDTSANQLPAISDKSCAMLIGRVLLDGVADYKECEKYSIIVGTQDRSALAEFDYQACETEDYRETTAGLLVASIEAETLAALALMRPAMLKAARAATETKREADKNSLKIAVDRIISENPKLIPGGREVVEKNIRIALKLAFPGVKFSVRKDGYDSTGVNWTDGPTTEEVDAIARRHKAGSFDGMTDCYEYRTSAFCEAFGGVRYVSTRREHSDEAMLATIQAVATRYSVPAISLDEYRRICWTVSPIRGACGMRDMWAGLVNSALENKDEG